MKKNLLFGMVAAVVILLATSCSNDETLGQPSEEAQVTLSLGLENGMGSRAISDGSGINQLHFAIFNSKDKMVQSSKGSDEVNFPMNKSFTLVKGMTYTAVFWAQNNECDAYTISEDMKSITVDYTYALNNDETRDAFFRSETFTVTEDMHLDIVLKRPFAQLNVGITEEEWNYAKDHGVEFTKSKVEIKKAATTLNLIDGSVENAVDVTFKNNSLLTEPLKVDIDGNGEQESYKYLSMSYFLAPDLNSGAIKTTLEDVKFTFSTEDEAVQIVLEEGLNGAPVQRNHRTNIIGGGVLTGDLSVSVKLDALYDGEHNLNNGDWEKYKGIYTEAALAGKTIEIPEGWHIRNGYILEPMPEKWNTNSSALLYTKPYTVDGKNNTITFEPYEYTSVTKNVFAATDGALVTVKNITFEGEHFGVFGGVFVEEQAIKKKYKTVFENMKMVNNGIYCYNDKGSNPISAFSNLGTATLTNCTITGTYWVGAEKDENQLVGNALNKGVYDVFVPNDGVTTLNSCEIGSIYVENHAQLTLSGTTKVNKINAPQLVNGMITVKENVEVALLDIKQFSDKYPPQLIVEAGATIETLQLNNINKGKITINDNAIIGKIIHNGVEYTTIADFKGASTEGI